MSYYSPDSSPLRRDRSPSASRSAAPRGPLGLGSLSRVAGTYANGSMLTPPVNPLSPDPGSTSVGSDYFGSNWHGRSSPTAQPYGRSNPPINPGAGNSFASNAPSNGRNSAAVSGRRKSSVQSAMTNTTTATSASLGTESSLVPGSPNDERRKAKKNRPSQKDMLSRALQKANDAVLLDNDSDLDGAVTAYQEACQLLKRVMMRSSVIDDRKKLDSIRKTYKDRILELRGSIALSGNELDEPMIELDADGGYMHDEEGGLHSERYTDLDNQALNEDSGASPGDQLSALSPFQQLQTSARPPPRRESLAQQAGSEPEPGPHQNSWQNGRRGPNVPLTLPRMPAANDTVVPAPLSPWKPRQAAYPDEPTQQPPPLPSNTHLNPHNLSVNEGLSHGHSRQETQGSTSWLDTIDESNDDSHSSVHSRASSLHDKGQRKNLVMRRSGATAAEYDAAFDEAIEAAYDDGMEPGAQEDEYYMFDEEHTIIPESNHYGSEGANAQVDIRTKLQAAKQRVAEAEREDALVRGFDKVQNLRSGRQTPAQLHDALYDPNDLEDEEAILAEMQEYGDMGLNISNAGPPSDIDPSNPSRNAWANPITQKDSGPPPPGGLPSIPKVTTGDLIPKFNQSPNFAPPSGALPDLPLPRKASAGIPPPIFTDLPSRSFATAIASPGVRERRLSGRKVGNLTIDTGSRLDPSMAAPQTAAAPLSKLSSMGQIEIEEPPKSAVGNEKSFASQLAKPLNLAPLQFDLGAPDTGSASPAHSHFARTPLSETKSGHPSAPASPARSINRPGTASGLRKNFSSTSLKSLKNAAATPTEESPQTPMSRLFSASSQPGHGSVPLVPELPTPAAGHFIRHGTGPGSFSFFNTDIHSLQSPGSPNPAIANGPAPLEPCPESFLLRPFWLLRCIYQTIANPHGGYLSTRLFVPRDIWRVRNVKLKNVEEKMQQCDMLTAALLKLARVDTGDADAVLEEMQELEHTLDSVQSHLAKKLGAEVGLQGSFALFKGNANGEDGVSGGGDARSTSTTGRISSSWRKLRSKNSAGPAVSMAGGASGLNKETRDTLTMKSLPMATGTVVPKKHVKRNPTKILGVGPHANYMAALARLSDAAQILDQVARQVEDPGLRLSSQTHVGLELCSRHAAEFFAFYICRFALADISAMLDKFVKRGSEWILN